MAKVASSRAACCAAWSLELEIFAALYMAPELAIIVFVSYSLFK
jgi:hypothetical protein